MKKDGKADATIQTAISRLKHLAKLCNVNEPEQVKTVLATLKWKNNSKHNVTQIYNGYVKHIGKTWTQPKYAKQSELPFIPTETEIDTLISASGKKTSALLQLLKETGARIGEIEKLQWTHLDQERKTVYITAEKGSNSRILPASDKLIAMLNSLPKTNERIFQTNRHALRTTFESLRNRTATKLNNPRLKNIHFHTFRHFKGTMEYHKTKDIIHVKTVLGHKRIESTMIYINIESALWLNQTDEWTSLVTHNIQEETKAINIGFELVRAINETTALYRKRK
jgi:integrase